MKKIRWVSKLDGVQFDGFVDGKERFITDNLELYDKLTGNRYNTYQIGGKEYGKKLANELINDINVVVNENLRIEYENKRELDSIRFQKLISDTEELLTRLKNK